MTATTQISATFDAWRGTTALIALVSFASVALYLISAVSAWYRLRKFPGPFLASFSYLWGVKAMSSGRMHRILPEVQNKYGRIVRIGPNELLIYDPETFLHINSVRSTYGRGGWYSSVRFDPYGHSLLSEPDTAKHDRRKAQLAGGYAGKGRMDLEKDVDSQLAVLVDLLRSKYASSSSSKNGGRSRPMDFGRIARYFTIDVTTLTGMGEPWGDLPTETDMFHFLGDSDDFVPFMHCISMSSLRDFFSSPFFLKLAGPKPTDKKGMGQFLGVAKKEAERRFKAGPRVDRGHGDMLDEWIKQGLTAREAELEIALQVPAGSETTTTAIRGTMLYLVSTPHVYQKLKDEIADGIRKGRISKPITNEEAKRLPYLQAVINEGLRMVPPAITGFSKRVPPEGDTICDRFVPGGTDIFVNVCAMLRNKEVFGDDADTFRPERFLEGDEAKRTQLVKHVDLVFGHGRWMCPGKTLAWIELNKIFVELLRSFDFQTVNPEMPWRCRGFSSFLIDQFWIRVREGSLD